MNNWIIFLRINSRCSTYVQIEFVRIIRLDEEKCDRKPIRLKLVNEKTDSITMEKAYLRVMRRGDEVMIQRMIHFLTDASIVRIEDITFGWKKVIGKTWTILVLSTLCYLSFTHHQYRDDPDTSLRKKVQILEWSLHISRVSLLTSNQTMQIRAGVQRKNSPPVLLRETMWDRLWKGSLDYENIWQGEKRIVRFSPVVNTKRGLTWRVNDRFLVEWRVLWIRWSIHRLRNTHAHLPLCSIEFPRREWRSTVFCRSANVIKIDLLAVSLLLCPRQRHNPSVIVRLHLRRWNSSLPLIELRCDCSIPCRYSQLARQQQKHHVTIDHAFADDPQDLNDKDPVIGIAALISRSWIRERARGIFIKNIKLIEHTSCKQFPRGRKGKTCEFPKCSSVNREH